ncbi:MAG: hypothetical protein AAGU75_12515 [Bacillota bacterium]
MKMIENPSNDLDQYLKEAAKSLEKLKTLKDHEKKTKNEDIKKMIDYYINMSDHVDDERIQQNTFAWQGIAISIAIIGWFYTLEVPLLFKIFVIVLMALLIGLAFLKIYEFDRQNSFDYPFLRIQEYGNQWKWFYYGNEYVKRLKPRKVEDETSEKSLYLQGLTLFVDKYREEDIDKEIVDNIQQLYLLHVHNYYKNRFQLGLNRFSKWTLNIIIIYFLLFLIGTMLLAISDISLLKSLL